MKIHVLHPPGNPTSKATRHGAALVEFATTVPIVFLLFFAAFDFCRLSMITHTAEQAAYEGARRGTIPGATTAQARNAAQAELDRIGIQQATISITPEVIRASTENVTVSVRIPLQVNGWISPQVLTDSFITRQCTLSREHSTND